VLTNEKLLQILNAFDAECRYDPLQDDETGSEFYKIAKESYVARKLLRDYLWEVGVLGKTSTPTPP